MNKGKKDIGFIDTSGKIYSIFLHFMLFTQMGFFVKELFANELFFCFIHLIAIIYFIFRIHIFFKLKDKANSAGYSLIEYLRDRYGT